MAIDIRRLTRLTIGINTENGVEEYRFDTSPWRNEHPGLHTFQLNVTPPGGMPYKAVTYMEGNILVWPITENDTALPGDNGLYEIEAFGDAGLHKLSPTKPLVVYARMVGDIGDAPTSIQSWVETANSVLEDNRAATSNAQKAAEDAQTAAAAAEAAARGAVVRNWLDNSDFRADHFIAQAGLNVSHGATLYVGDRWCRAGGCTSTSQTDGLLVTSLDQYSFIQQRVKLTIGKTYTLALRTKNRSSLCRVAISNYKLDAIYGEKAENSDLLILTFTAQEINQALLFYPGYTEGGGSAVFEWAALYEGSYTADTLPAYQYKGYAAELAECQRYYQRLMNPDFMLVTLAEGKAFTIKHPNMRIIPSVTVKNPATGGINSITSQVNGGEFAVEFTFGAKNVTSVMVPTGAENHTYGVSYEVSADL